MFKCSINGAFSPRLHSEGQTFITKQLPDTSALKTQCLLVYFTCCKSLNSTFSFRELISLAIASVVTVRRNLFHHFVPAPPDETRVAQSSFKRNMTTVFPRRTPYRKLYKTERNPKDVIQTQAEHVHPSPTRLCNAILSMQPKLMSISSGRLD